VDALAATLTAPVEQLFLFLIPKDILVTDRARLSLVLINLSPRHLAVQSRRELIGSSLAIVALDRTLARVPPGLHAKAGDGASPVLDQFLQLRIDHRLLPHARVVDAEAEHSNQNERGVLAGLGRRSRPTGAGVHTTQEYPELLLVCRRLEHEGGWTGLMNNHEPCGRRRGQALPHILRRLGNVGPLPAGRHQQAAFASFGRPFSKFSCMVFLAIKRSQFSIFD
jgi:hypothetical protein